MAKQTDWEQIAFWLKIAAMTAMAVFFLIFFVYANMLIDNMEGAP